MATLVSPFFSSACPYSPRAIALSGSHPTARTKCWLAPAQSPRWAALRPSASALSQPVVGTLRGPASGSSNRMKRDPSAGTVEGDDEGTRGALDRAGALG